MRIFITGGDGYIGSNFVNRFGARHELVLYGHGTNYDMLRSRTDKQFTAVVGDIAEEEDMIHWMKGCDVVIHLAARMDNESAIRNIGDTAMVVDAAVKASVSKFIFASSYSVYGGLDGHRVVNENTPPAPRNMYAKSKLASEDDLHRAGINWIVLRFSHVYGYGIGMGDTGGIINRWIDDGIKGKIEITKNDIRDYIHVQDVVSCINNAILVQNINREVFNVASGASVTLLQLAKLLSGIIKKETGHAVAVQFSEKDYEWPLPYVDIDKARHKLKFNPKEEGLIELVKRRINDNNR